MTPRQAWYEESPTNVCGHAHAITTVSQIKPPLGWLTVRLYFAVGRRLTFLSKRLRSLSFIHAARWTVVRRVPGGPRLRSPMLLFESNFNGAWGQYIDAFAYVIPSRMSGVWGTSWGWPGPKPAGPFKAFIRRNEHDALHYYAAYPGVTVTEVHAALQLKRAYSEFESRSRTLTAPEFDAAWREFLTSVQVHL